MPGFFYAMKKTLLLVLFAYSFCCSAQVLRKRTTLLMGSRWQITIVAKDSLAAEQNIDTCIAEVSRIENLISDWRPQTQVSQVNQNAGVGAIKVDREVFELTRRALSLSQLTGGAFDISFAALDKVWKFDGSMTVMPSTAQIKQSVAKVGYKNIILDRINSTIFLKLKGMKIGFGALGEGYAADRCRAMMLARGIKAGIVNGSGDMNTWGKQPDGSDWNIGITNPFKEDRLIAVVPVRQGAVVTSGSYEKFVVFNGKRYAHIINPATGYPATGLISVTIFGPSAERANGFSTSMMVLGKDKAMQFIKRVSGYRYIMITDEGRVYSSPSLKFKIHQLR
jgi:thiamine biosynthesis lipoprotein